NANEVIARLASVRLGASVHPNDHVNMSQSSNDVFPSAVHLAAALAMTQGLAPAMEKLTKALRKKQREFAHEVKSGRTHLMDATPVTLGQEFGGYAAQIEAGIARMHDTLPRLCALPLGGTAVGTGINAPKGFARKVIARLATRTGLPLTEAKDHFAAQGARDALVETSGQLRVLAVSLIKIANDLRWMASGPRTGLGEIRLPDLQPGSSIMPGKVNPVIPEVVTQVSAQVIGNDAAIAFGGSQGNFELNVFVPIIARNLLESIDLLASACSVFADKCVRGIEANSATLERNAESSPVIATALVPHLGYETTAGIIKESNRTGKSIRQVVRSRKLMTDAELDRALDVEAMTRGGIIE
ncbi:MAG: fumarate hydratase, class, partial [Actinomycetota bacterium]|nr:fumarate hydratase, class [Actinomycetota bacterium]